MRLCEYLTEAEHVELAILFLDLDNFKPYNDTFGHDAGDIVLVGMANIFKEVTDKKGFVCRYGGDEFIIVAHTTDKETLEKMVHEIYSRIEVTAHLPLMEMDLSGEYQSDNLRTSLAALSLLHVTPDYEAINHTARISGLHGRWEIISKRPLTLLSALPSLLPSARQQSVPLSASLAGQAMSSSSGLYSRSLL